MSIKTKTISVFLSIATVLTLSGAVTPLVASAALTQAQIDSIISLLQSFGADSTTISNVRTSLSGGTPSGTTGTGTYTFSADLKLGSTGADVMNLQKVLNSDSATQVAASGVGSSGNETTYFGSLTQAAAMKFQTKYGISPVAGYVGPLTRAKLNTISGGTTGTTGTTGGTTVVTPQGTGLTVTAGVQPTASIAPYGASRIPFTVVNFTASSDGDVTVNSIVVERTGLAADIVLSGIILLDENNQQIGLEKTLNSLHQVTLSEPFTVKAGTTKTMVLAGNRPTAATAHGGEIAYLSLVAVNTSATINGTLPITGTGQTINETLVLGSVTMARGSLDPGADSDSKEIGTTGYTFSGVRMTAGSGENIRLLSIRWYQSGSAASGDLANVKTYVDGVAYSTVLSSDGKYYSSTFGNGIVIEKGFNKEASIKADIIGGSARTVTFDIYKQTDIYLKGETYGYGITPPVGALTGDGQFTATQPWYNAYDVTVSAGTMNVSKSTSVAAQNIAINLANQPLGGFVVDVKGEPVSVSSMTFRLSEWDGTDGTTYTQCVTGISLYDENGAVVAGPVDITVTSPNVALTDTVTFPVGTHVYTLKGKLTTDYANNQTIAASTTPASDWGTVKGSVTGVTITPTGGTITASTMTVKAGALTVNVQSVPLAQTVIAGVSQFLFANYILDAGTSGEDIKLNSMAFALDANANPTKITNCKLYDGSTILTTGSNIVNPIATTTAWTGSSTVFTLDGPYTIPKGVTKTLGLKCDVAGSATAGNWYTWGLDSGSSSWSPSGKESGEDIGEALTDSIGQRMTIAAVGSYTVVDDSTPGYTIVSAGTLGVTLLKLKFAATSEAIDISKVAFQLATASNTPKDLVGQKVTLYDEANPTVEIGSATWGVSSIYATSTAIVTGTFRVPSGGYKTMLVKGDIAAISGTVGPLIASGDLLKVSYDGDDTGATSAASNGNYGQGVNSGTSVASATVTDIDPTGVRIMKSYPTLAKLALPTKLLQTTSGATLYRFSVTANGGDVYLYKFSITISSSTYSATTTKFGLYAYTASDFSIVDSTFSSDGLLNFGNYVNDKGANSPTTCTAPYLKIAPIELYMGKSAAIATTTYKVPSGVTRYFAFKADVCNVETSSSVTEYITVRLEGDLAYSVNASTLMETADGLDGTTNDDFIWSPNSTSSSNNIGDLDFTNGYSLSGLPSTFMDTETLTSSLY